MASLRFWTYHRPLGSCLRLLFLNFSLAYLRLSYCERNTIFATLWRLLCPCLQPLGSLAVGLEFHGGSCRLSAVGAAEPLNYWYWCAGVGWDLRVLFPSTVNRCCGRSGSILVLVRPYCCCIAQRRFRYHRDLCGFFFHLFLLGRIVLRPSLLYHLQR
jgi:hypothetical protein